MPKPPQPEGKGLSPAWAYRATGVGFEFVLPILAGVWVDRKLNSSPWGVLIGAVLGFLVGMAHLIRLAKSKPGS